MWDDAGAAGRIMQRIKAQLDPSNVLNPGRFVAGHLSVAHAHATRRRAAGPAHAARALSVEGVNQCVHCGLCLASCPTFSELGTEMDSPRGRIFLIKSLAEGRIGLSDPTVEHLSLCLDCRACETVCPAGVPYGQLIEAAKAEIERQRPGGAGAPRRSAG